MRRLGKRVLKIVLWVLGSIVLLLLAAYVLLLQPSVQTYVSQQFASSLSEQLGTRIEVEGVDISFFNKLVLEGVYVEDEAKDTLLYAGAIKVGIKDFSLAENRFAISEVVLENTQANLRKRADSTLNLQFILDSFKSDDTTAKKPLHLDLRIIALVNFKANIYNELNTEDISIGIPDGRIVLDNFDMAGKRIEAELVHLNNLAFHYDRTAPNPNAGKPFKKLPPVRLLGAGWQLATRELKITDGAFSHFFHSKPVRNNAIDFNRLSLDSLNIHITDLTAQGDTILGSIQHLSLQESTGFNLQKLKTNVLFSATGITCDSMEVLTDHSHITRFFSMQFRTLRDFYRFDKKVKMDSDLDGARVSFMDLAFFIPNLDPEDLVAELNGRFRGKVSNLKGKNISVRVKENNEFRGNLAINGLPNIRESFIDMEAKSLRTSVHDLALLFPGVAKSQEFNRLGMMRFSGTFIGFFKDFVANGFLDTDLGTVYADINLKLSDKKGTFFSGKMNSRRFELGRLVGQDPLLGPIAMKLNIYGSGTSAEDINAKLQASIDEITFNDYTYRNVLVDGEFQQRLFSGLLVVKDENLTLDFQGTVDLNQTRPDLKFTANIRGAKLGKLNFFENEYILNTRLNLDLDGKNIDDVLGTVDVFGTSITFGQTTYTLDSLKLISRKNGKRQLAVESNILNGAIEGNFNIASMNGEVRKYLNAYLPWLAIEQKGKLQEQDFTFHMTINDPQDLIEFLIPELQNFDHTSMRGSYKSATNDLSLTIDAPEFEHNTRGYENLKIKASSTKAGLAISTFLDKIVLSDSLQLAQPRLSAVIQSDSVFIRLQAGDDSSRNLIDLNTLLLNKKGLLSFQVLPSILLLNGEAWNVSAGNYIHIEGKKVSTQNFKIGSGKQVLSITSDSVNTLNMEVKNISLDNLSLLVNPSQHHVGGLLNGVMKISDPLGRPVFTSIASVNDLTLGRDLLGNLIFKANTDETRDKLSINSFLTNKAQRLSFTGAYQFSSPDSALAFNINLAGVELANFERWVADIFSGTTGKASGFLKLRGSLKKPVMQGGVQVMNLKTRVAYLNVPYEISSQIVEFKENEILMENMTITDTLGNKALAQGKFTHEYFMNMGADITVKMDQMLLLNTTVDNNSLYYGKGIGGGSISFKGPFKQMAIDMQAKTLSGTNIAIPIDDETQVDQGSFVTFVDRSKTTAEPEERGGIDLKGMDINIDLEVTPEAEMTMILDVEAGDMIRGAGLGNVKMSVNKQGDFNMYGTVEIDRGDYNFTLYNSLINKKFDIDQGGTVSWTGDPYGARLNMRAIYGLRASPYPLVQNEEDILDEEKKAYRRRIPVDVHLNLSGTLLASNPTFDIQTREEEAATGSYLTNKLGEIKADENELNKQVFGLLVLNSFIPTELQRSDVVRSGVNTSVSEFLSAQLSNWASEFTEDLDVYVNYYGGADLGAGSQEDITRRRELQLALTKRFFNNRVSVDVGGNIDLDDEVQSNENASQLAGDFTIEYRITEDGKVRVKVFRETDYDVLIEQNRTKTGVGMFYRREFDKVSELLTGKKKKKKKKT